MYGNFLRPFITHRKRGQLLDKLANQSEQHAQFEQLAKEEDQFNREVLINALTATTAVIHVAYGGQLFVLNGLGYLAFLAARRMLPKREAYQQYVRDGLFGYTGITAVAYFVAYGSNSFNFTAGLSTKMIEFLLMYTLWQDRQAANQGGYVEASDLEAIQAKLEELSASAAPA